MKPLDYIIASIIGFIVIGQCYIFYYTLNKINLLKTIFPKSDRFKTIKIFLPENEISILSNEDISKNIYRYNKIPDSDQRRYFTIKTKDDEISFPLIEFEKVLERYSYDDIQILFCRNKLISFFEIGQLESCKKKGWSLYEKKIDYVEMTLFAPPDNCNYVFKNIIDSINTYLIRNKGAISDFSLVKDIVDRNCDAEDEEINTLLPIPLYCGLMGTMLGIIIGLFAMPSINDDTFESSIPILMGGVKIAMIASLVGLILTTIGSGILHKGARSTIEGLKNAFFSFIQVELLPSISNSATNSIITLQTNLLKFNEGFTSNVSRFDSVLTQILSSFDNQMSIIQDLKNIDIAQVANHNVVVMQELRKTTTEFEKFNEYISQVNEVVKNAEDLNNSLKSDLDDIENRKFTVQQAFTKVNDSFEKGLIQLRDSTDERLKDTQKANLLQQDVFEKYLEQNRDSLKEIVDNEKGLLVEQISQNAEVLSELKKQSELRSSFDSIEHAIMNQNKVFISQNSTLEKFSVTIDALNKTLKKPSSNLELDSPTNNIKPPFVAKVLGYIFISTGIIAFLAVIVFLINKAFPIF